MTDRRDGKPVPYGVILSEAEESASSAHLRELLGQEPRGGCLQSLLLEEKVASAVSRKADDG